MTTEPRRWIRMPVGNGRVVIFDANLVASACVDPPVRTSGPWGGYRPPWTWVRLRGGRLLGPFVHSDTAEQAAFVDLITEVHDG